MIKIKKGLDLPIKGKPEQVIRDSITSQVIAVLGRDYPGIRPSMAVKESETVVKGQLLFSDKNMPAIRFTAPGTGRVKAIHRGARRKLLAVEIALSGTEEISFNAYSEDQLAELTTEQIKGQLLESGLWTVLRARPFNKVANPDTSPHSSF